MTWFFAIILGLFFIVRLIRLLKMVLTAAFWQGLAVHAGFFLVIFTIVNSRFTESAFLGFLPPVGVQNVSILGFVWLAATYLAAKAEIDIKQQNLPKSKWLGVIAPRIAVVFLVFILSAIVSVISQSIIKVTSLGLLLTNISLLAWIGIIIKYRPSRVPLVFLLHIVFLGFLVARLDNLYNGSHVTASGDAGHHPSLLSDDGSAHHNAAGAVSADMIHNTHSVGYATVAPSINTSLSDNFNHAPDQFIPAEQAPVMASDHNLSGDSNIIFNVNDSIKHTIQNSYGFSVATINESSTHITITGNNGEKLFLYPDGTGGYAIQGPDHLRIGHLTAGGTIEDVQSLAVGHIKHVGSDVVLTDSKDMAVERIDGTTGTIHNQQGLMIGKIRGGDK